MQFSGYHYYTTSYNEARTHAHAGSNPARGVLGNCDGQYLWQWFWPKLKLNSFSRLVIQQNNSSSSSEEFCEIFNQFSFNVVPSLNVPNSEHLEPVISITKSFASIVKIKATAFDSTFRFRRTSCNEVEKIIDKFNIKKTC